MRNEFKKILLNKNILVINNTNEIGEKLTEEELGSMLLSFASIGFTVEKESIELLRKYSKDTLKDFYFNTIELLKEAKGDNVKHIVFYENFPNLESISQDEYVLRAVLHYYTSDENSYGYMARDIKRKDRPLLKDKSELTSLTILKEDEAVKVLVDYANKMFESKTAITLVAQKSLKLLVNDFAYFISPNEIPFKENLSTKLLSPYFSKDKSKCSLPI